MDVKELIEELSKLKPEERATEVAPLFDDASTTGAVLAKVNAVKNRLVTQEYVDKTIIPAAKKGTVKQKELEELKAEHDRVKGELKKLKETPPDQNPDVQKQMESLNAQWQARFSELEERNRATEAQRLEAEQSRVATAESHTMQAELLSAGVVKGKEDQAFLIAKRDIPNLQLFEQNGKSKMVIVDPLTNDQKDASPVLKAWVEQNTHFAKPDAPGGGLPPSRPGPAPAPGDPTAGMTGTQRISYALRNDPAFKPKVDISKLPIIGEPNPSQGGTD